jgi:lipopolysaccharide O-acetyltransferase
LVRQPLISKGPVKIGPSCFLGYRVAVLPGVSLGAHCVVGAHSVVTRSFPPYSMLAGVPARIIRRFNPSNNVWEAL